VLSRVFGTESNGITRWRRPEGGVEVQLYSFFNLGTRWVGGQRHAPSTLRPGKRHDTYCTGGRVGPRAGLDGCGNFVPTGIRSLDRPDSNQSL
jgi:hypothetical protein